MNGIVEAWVSKIKGLCEENGWTYRELVEQTPYENIKQGASQLSSKLKHGGLPSFKLIWAFESLVGAELTEKAIKEKYFLASSSEQHYKKSLEDRERYRAEMRGVKYHKETPAEKKTRRELTKQYYLAKAWELDAGRLDYKKPAEHKNQQEWNRFFDEIAKATGTGTPYRRNALCAQYGLHPQYLNQMLTRRRPPTQEEFIAKLENLSQDILGHGILEE